MSAASELDKRLADLQTQVGELVARLQTVQSLQESLTGTAGSLSDAGENMSKLVVELRSVIGGLEAIPQFFKAAVAAFERTEPTKMVDDISARLDELGKVVAAAESKAVEATRTSTEEAKDASEHAINALKEVIQNLLAEQAQTLLEATRASVREAKDAGERANDATRDLTRELMAEQTRTLGRRVWQVGIGLLAAIAVASTTALWVLLSS